jgi:chromosome segregation ATPase
MSRRNRSPTARAAESPERELRLEEQRDLSQLNMQLENYVMTIRRREAELLERISNGEHITIVHHQETLNQIRADYENKIAKILQDHNTAVVQVEELNRRLHREIRKNEELQKTIKQLEQVRDELQTRIARLSHDLDIAEAKYSKDVGEIGALKAQLNAAKKSEADVLDELESLREKNRDLDSKLHQERDMRLAAKEDLNIAKSNFERERKGLLKKLEGLGGDADLIERQIRAELEEQFRQKLHEMEQDRAAAHDEIIRKQLDDFNNQIEDFRERESALIAERDELRGQLEKVRSSSFNNSKEKEDLERKLSALEKKIASLLDQLDDASNQHNRVVNNKNSEISRLLAKLKQVQDERNILFTLGVGLKKAVETYEEIVSSEEERRGVKRQKVSQSPSKGAASPSKPVTRSADKGKELSTSVSPKRATISTTKVPLSGKRKSMA